MASKILPTGFQSNIFSVSVISNTTNFGSVTFGGLTVMLKVSKEIFSAPATDSATCLVLIALALPTTHSKVKI